VAQERERAQEMRSEGLMLKHKDSPYAIGRKKGTWWKWKSDPKTIDAVLTYAMLGHGRRTNLYSDYTFALWQEEELVTFAKAYSGLTDAEIKQVDQFVKKNTTDRFGPVRQVKPELVFEIAFEGIAPSPRHKSGVAVRFPRILRWRHDKKIAEANNLEDIKKLLP
jgi:DNA ligase-1